MHARYIYLGERIVCCDMYKLHINIRLFNDLKFLSNSLKSFKTIALNFIIASMLPKNYEWVSVSDPNCEASAYRFNVYMINTNVCF